MRRWFPIVAAVSFPCLAQQDSIAYFREFENKIATQLFVLNKSNDFVITEDDSDLEIAVVPNNKTTLNIGFQYDIVSFSVGYAPRFFAENRSRERSSMSSFQLDFFPGRWVQRLEFHNQKGMTLEPKGTSATLYFRNLESTRIGGSTDFFLNRKFSYRAIALQNVQQLRSAGSLSGGLSYHYTVLDGNDEPGLEGKTAFYDIAITPAYHYNWVIGKHVNLAGGIAIGAGINFTVDGGETNTSALYTSGILLAPGYNSNQWFFGANLRASYADRQVENGLNVGDSMVYATVFVGYRFDAPDYLTQKTRQIKNNFQTEKK